ncbi:hypothetical protein OROHE_012456 [Orobanche hederae]
MKRTLEDSSQNHPPSSSYLTKVIKPCLKEEGEHNNVSDHVIGYSPTVSEEIETKYSSDNDTVIHKKTQIRKSQSLGSGLNQEQRTSGDYGSEDEMEQRFSYDGYADRNKNRLSLSDKFPDPISSDSVQVGSDLSKNISVFSFGEPQPTEKEGPDEDGVYLFGMADSCDVTPRIVKSSSLPRMGSPNQCFTSLVARSRSAEDLNLSNSWKEGTTHEAGKQVRLQYQERDDPMFHNDKNNGENRADRTDETYNCAGLANDWIVPVPDGENSGKCVVGETSSHNWDEVPAKEIWLKRIEEWVTNLQPCGPMEEYEESESPCYDEDLSKHKALLEEIATALKSEVRVSPGMEAAKRYISSLNASATAAQLTNLGLVVIPFLSAFISLKALNLSGNAIVRIAAGALPRGLHILNLAKNSISIIEGLRDLTRLRVLDLSYNRILRIGHGLGACSALKELYLAGNKISEVEGLHRLLKLNILDLRFNKISTTKCLGQLAANYNCLQALSLEGNPAQKNVGDEQLKKYVQSLLPHLMYYNRQSIKVGTMKDAAERSARLGISSHQVDRGLRVEVKTTTRKGTHGIVPQKVLSSSSSSNYGRKGQGVVISTAKATRSSRHGRLLPSGMKTTGHWQGGFMDVSSKIVSLRNDFSFPRSRSEGNLGAL